MINTSLTSVDDYIAAADKAVRPVLRQLRTVIKHAAPGAEEKISYGMPAYKQNGVLVYFAVFKHHIGFYPGASGVTAFEKQIKKFHASKGTIQFPLDKAIPVKLIKDIVRFRVKQNEEKLLMKQLAKSKRILVKKKESSLKKADD